MDLLLLPEVQYCKAEIIELLLNIGVNYKTKMHYHKKAVNPLVIVLQHQKVDYSTEILKLFGFENKNLQDVFAKHSDREIVRILKLLLDHNTNYGPITNIRPSPWFNKLSFRRKKTLLISQFRTSVALYINENNHILNAIKGGSLSKIPDRVNIRDKDGLSALHLAVKGGNIDIVKLLLDGGAEPNIRSWRSLTTPLHNAVLNNRVDIVKLLLDNHANPNILSRSDTSPLYFAVVNNYKEISRLLLECGAKPETLLNQLSALLNNAATTKNEEMEEILGKIDYLGKFLHEQGINTIDLFTAGMKKASMSGNDEIARKICCIISDITFPSELEPVSVEGVGTGKVR